eukprot:2370275-Amphidinium_carterae.1
MSQQQSLALCVFRGQRLVRRGGNFGTFRVRSRIIPDKFSVVRDYVAGATAPSGAVNAAAVVAWESMADDFVAGRPHRPSQKRKMKTSTLEPLLVVQVMALAHIAHMRFSVLCVSKNACARFAGALPGHRSVLAPEFQLGTGRIAGSAACCTARMWVGQIRDCS